MGSLAPCEMCDNGLGDHVERVGGSEVRLCSSCRSLLAESGRLEDSAEATP